MLLRGQIHARSTSSNAVVREHMADERLDGQVDKREERATVLTTSWRARGGWRLGRLGGGRKGFEPRNREKARIGCGNGQVSREIGGSG